MPFTNRRLELRARLRVATSWSVSLVVVAAPPSALCCSGRGSAGPPGIDGGSTSPPLDAGLLDGAVHDGALSPAEDATAMAPDVQPAVYAVCDDAVAPAFPSLLTGVFGTGSCGTSFPYDCHSSTGALPIAEGGTGSLLDFSLDASSVFAELIGDGSGFPASNVMGTDRSILRVAPGHADASLLYIKLAMPTARDPLYGEAMPPTGLVCPATLEAVRVWIDDGASP